MASPARSAPEPQPTATARAGSVLAALALLYTAQGVPFGIASEYLPIVLREAHYTMTGIAVVGWLQLPWQLKILWAHLPDGEIGRRHGRPLLLGLQLALAASVALYALRPLAEAPPLWFVLTATAALLAATQDVFVDAAAVRMLSERDRGVGNIAQVAGYRLGMLAGGAGLLGLVDRLGSRRATLSCAALVGAASVGAALLRKGGAPPPRPVESRAPAPHLALVRHLLSAEAWPVIALALSYKLGLHMASHLLKPMVVDAGWTKPQISLAVVTAGTIAALAGAGAGGLLHRLVPERRALLVAGLLQALVCVPLLVSLRLGVPHGWTTAAIASEHFATGVGTTVLFAALMTATRRSQAGLHYTVLTSANALAIGLGSLLGGVLGDHLGKQAVFGIAAATSLAPLALLSSWDRAAAASAREPAAG